MERLIFDWNFEVDAWLRFWRWNLIKICVWTLIWTQPSGPLCLYQCLFYAHPCVDRSFPQAGLVLVEDNCDLQAFFFLLILSLMFLCFCYIFYFLFLSLIFISIIVFSSGKQLIPATGQYSSKSGQLVVDNNLYFSFLLLFWQSWCLTVYLVIVIMNMFC